MKLSLHLSGFALIILCMLVSVCVETGKSQLSEVQQATMNEHFLRIKGKLTHPDNDNGSRLGNDKNAGNEQLNSDAIAPARTFAPGDEKWDDRFCEIGTNYNVWCMAAMGDDVIFGGEFTTAGGATINHIAKWDGRSYTPLGEGLTVSFPYMIIAPTPIDMVVHGTDLYVCGNFLVAGNDTVNGIAKWDGSRWSSLGDGADRVIETIVIDGNYLYAGGAFRTIDGVAANSIARYNLTTGIWEPLGPGLGNEIGGDVSEILVHNGIVYAGGNFNNAGETSVNHIAFWDGVSWYSMNGGVMSSVAPFINTMVMIGDNLYIGGFFVLAGEVIVNNIARWHGGNWYSIGSGTDWTVSELLYDGEYLYIVGGFNVVNGTSASHIAKIDPATNIVTPMGAGLFNTVPSSGAVTTLINSGTDFFAGGIFTGSDSVNAYNVARWNESEGGWSALGKGLNSNVYAISVRPGYPSEVFVGGQFSRPEGKFYNRVAKFTGEDWMPMGSGATYFCYAMAATSSACYIAGSIVNAGGLSVNNIAKWTIDPEAWSALGSGLTGGFNVNAVAVRGTELFAGGDFTTAGGNPASRIARWDGTSWAALGSGVNGEVRAIAVTDSFVYVGGYFTSAGGNAANYVARWDGTSWTALGSGPTNGTDYRVDALAVSGNTVFVGGTFESAGGVSALNIAKWNSATNTWSALGSGASYYGYGSVNAIAAIGSNVYVGGAINSAGGVSVNNIALWNDSSGVWSALGSGVDNNVKTLAVSSTGKLYVGGIFLNAGGKPSRYFAIWDGSSATAPNPPVPVLPANDSSCIALNPTLQWNISEGAVSYRAQVSTDSLFAATIFDSSGIASPSIVVPGLSPLTRYYWRVNASNTAGTSSWSTVLHFTTGAGVLLAPLQVSPANGVTGVPTVTTVYWERTCGAQSYILQIGYDTNFTSVLFNSGGITRTWYDLTELLTATWHYWRLRSVNGVDTSAWSPTWKFRTVGGEPNIPQLAGPANDSMCVTLNPLLRWNSAIGATSYGIQLSIDSLFSTTVLDTENVSSTSITVSGLVPLTTYYWHVNASNIAGTSAWSSTWHFTTRAGILVSPAQTSPVNGAYNIPVVTTLYWERPCGAQSFFLQIAYDSSFTSLIFSNGGITQTLYNLYELPTSTWHYWRLRSISGTDTSGWSPAWKFQTVGGAIEVSVSVNALWNLVSTPVTRTDYRRSIIYPASTTTAYIYNGLGYTSAETLAHRKGYWLKFGSTGSVNISGISRMVDTFNVIQGWNLIGSISQAIAVKNIMSIPPELLVSNFYGYNHGYVVTDSIKPGKGYWVHAGGSGQLILSAASLSSMNGITIVPSSELPPTPPETFSDDAPLPTSYRLGQNYPNPFNPVTTFNYQLAAPGYVTLTIYTMLGEEVAMLVHGVQDAGYKTIEWNASGLPSGVYYYRMTAHPLKEEINRDGLEGTRKGETFFDMKKLILLK